MVPVEEPMESPAGRWVALYVRVAVLEESVALTPSGLMAAPDTLDWSPGPVTDTVLVTVQVNRTLPLPPAPSVAVTVTA
jgi:hypothetical protein